MSAADGSPEDDLVARLFEARNQDLEERTRLYVARHKSSGLYSIRLQRFLVDFVVWRQEKPTIEDVRREVAHSAEHAPMWTTDLQAAEVWDSYHIERLREFLVDIEFETVRLKVEPLSRA